MNAKNLFFKKKQVVHLCGLSLLFDRMGLIGLVSDIDSVTQVTNRQNPKLYRAYATLLREKELIVGHGRLGALRVSD